MKKKRFVNVLFIVLSFIMIVTAFILKDLSAATQLELPTFKSYMEKKGCTVINKEDSQEGIAIHYETDNNTCPYSVSYYIVTDSKKRKEIYEEMKSIVKDNTNINSKENVNYHSINYDEVSTTGDNYKAVIKYKNNILFIDVSSNLKDEALSFKKDIGYYIEHKSYIYKDFLMYSVAILIAMLYINGKFIGSSKVKVGAVEIINSDK